MMTEIDRHNAYQHIIEDIAECSEGAVTAEGECICYIYPCHRFKIKEALENIEGLLYNNTAEWNSYGCCSNCGYNAKHLDVSEYCPSCGRKMIK